MKAQHVILKSGHCIAALSVLIFLSIGVTSEQTKNEQIAKLSLRKLLKFQYPFEIPGYKAKSYIQVAKNLQLLGQKKAGEILLQYAREYEHDKNILILCRLLYKQRGSQLFERPCLGGASFPGGTKYEDWSLEPIEIVDGVPFFVSVNGYYGTGECLPYDQYVLYCIRNCDWNSFLYIEKRKEEREVALSKMLASPKWKYALTAEETRLFTTQIE